MTYFAVDGSYGDSDCMVVLDTSDWEEMHWNLCDGVRSNHLPVLARQIDSWVRTDFLVVGSLLWNMIEDYYPELIGPLDNTNKV